MMDDKHISLGDIRDVAIIGAGPVGLFAVFECGMLGLSCHVLDALPDIGGQCAALYPEKPIYDIPAHPSIDGASLIAQLERQAAPFKPLYHLNQQIVSIGNNGSFWTLLSDKGISVQARTIIIAGGAGAFGPNRPPLDGIETYEGHSVFYMVKTKADFEGKTVVIAGGGDSAVDWAVALASIARHIYVVHRRDKFRAAPDSVKQLMSLSETNKIELVVPYQLKSLQGDGKILDTVIVSTLEGQERALKADTLLAFFGLSNTIGPLADWGLDMDGHHIVVDPLTGATNLAGIYAIGDIVSYKHKLKLILTGFAEAAQAAHAIYRQLHPDTPLHFEHSTTKGLPKAS